MKVLIVDDHTIVREGIRMVLELEDEYEVVGEAANGQQALELVEKDEPDVILLDLYMPILDGISFLRTLKNMGKTIPCIVLTTYKEPHLLLEAVNLGVKSYLLKDAGRKVIYETITRVMNGETWFPADIQQLIHAATSEKTTPSSLTTKELTILKLVAQGYKNKELADQLFVSEKTIKNYLTIIYDKLDVKSRTQAIAAAIERKLL